VRGRPLCRPPAGSSLDCVPFVGLVSDPRWEPPDQPERRPPEWHVPWGVVAWVVVITGLALAVPTVDRLIGSLAAYVLLLVTVAVAVWRVDRWCARQYWRGLRDYQP
jgi:hypothetical protein